MCLSDHTNWLVGLEEIASGLANILNPTSESKETFADAVQLVKNLIVAGFVVPEEYKERLQPIGI